MIERLRNTAREIQALFEQIDSDVKGFQHRTGITCTAGCGHCCNNPGIEAAPEEFFLLALSLWENGTSMEFLRMLEKDEGGGVCVFYSHKQSNPDAGYCTRYEHRALICRLFGFSTMHDKTGSLHLAACAAIRNQVRPDSLETSGGSTLSPGMEIYSGQYEDIFGGAFQKKYPINTAMKMAVEKMGYLFDNTPAV